MKCVLSADYQEDIDLVSQIFRVFELADKLYTFSQSAVVKLYDSGVLEINNQHLHESFNKE